jgi:hypothetical protein
LRYALCVEEIDVVGRIALGIAIGALLLAIVVATLMFADIYSVVEETKRCAPHFPQWSQFPAWLGCTTSVHEGLAGGLIGGAGALFAAWLAFTAVQEQLGEERYRRRQQQADAKEAAIVCITQLVHAAATVLVQINDAIRVGDALQETSDRLVRLAVDHVKAALESFTVRESGRDLSVDDKVMYLLIVSTLSTFVNISTNPSPILTRGDRLQNQRFALMRLHTYLGAFDSELAQVYARDSGTEPPEPTVTVDRRTT